MAAIARRPVGVHVFSRHNLAAICANPVLQLGPAPAAPRQPAQHVRTYKAAQAILARADRSVSGLQRQLRARGEYQRKIANFDICAQWNRPSLLDSQSEMQQLEAATLRLQLSSGRRSPARSPTQLVKRLAQHGPRKMMPTPPRTPLPASQRRKLPSRPVSAPSSHTQAAIPRQALRPQLSLHELPAFVDDYDVDEPEVANLFGSMICAGDRPRPAISCNLFAGELLTVAATTARSHDGGSTLSSPTGAAPALGSRASAFAALCPRRPDGAEIPPAPLATPATRPRVHSLSGNPASRTHLSEHLRHCNIDALFQPV